MGGSDQVRSDQYRSSTGHITSDQAKTNYPKPDQSKSNHTRTGQTRGEETRSHQSRSIKQIKSKQIESVRILPSFPSLSVFFHLLPYFSVSVFFRLFPSFSVFYFLSSFVFSRPCLFVCFVIYLCFPYFSVRLIVVFCCPSPSVGSGPPVFRVLFSQSFSREVRTFHIYKQNPPNNQPT